MNREGLNEQNRHLSHLALHFIHEHNIPMTIQLIKERSHIR